jgi:lipopolysaccharide export system protein LptA
MHRHFLFATLATVMALHCGWVLAAKEDQSAPTAIESDSMTYDELKQTNVFTGNVRLVRGTLILKGDRLTLRQTPEGFQVGEAEGKPASFRQRRDGPGEPYVEGYAERIDYDGKADTVVLSKNAELRKLEGKKITNEVKGDTITYVQRTEFFTVTGDNSATKAGTSGRVKVIIQPKEERAGKP